MRVYLFLNPKAAEWLIWKIEYIGQKLIKVLYFDDTEFIRNKEAMSHTMPLPELLEAYRPLFDLTARSAIHLLPLEEPPTLPWESRIGGAPWLPVGKKIPACSKGKPMQFLAQLNLEEFPTIWTMPAKGILQFYLSEDALDEDYERGDASVLYFEEIEKQNDWWEEHAVPFFEDGPFEKQEVFKLDYLVTKEWMPGSDYRFREEIGRQLKTALGADYWTALKAYSEKNAGLGHKLGGYSYFAQDDPRFSWEIPGELLFQLDSDEAINCYWGDMGAGHFFIAEEALKNKDFSKVQFYWDCH